jgi:predicted glycosyltransferase
VLFFAPIVRRLRDQGHEVTITAREYAQTQQLLEDHGMAATVSGHHRGRNVAAKALGLLDRSVQLIGFGRRAGFDVAAGHNSNDLSVAARALRIPQLTMFDYEFARVSHHVNLRLVDEIVVPEAIPVERLVPYGIRAERIIRYPGLKEEYYLHDFEPDATILERLQVDPASIVVVLRPAPEVTLYHRVQNPLVDELIAALAAREDVTLVIVPRTLEQRERYAADPRPNVVVPERAVDGLSLIAAADMVIGAGGTMNREAVALGTPAYTLFAGRLGAVDERLIAEGRLHRVAAAAEVKPRKKKTVGGGQGSAGDPPAARRDPQFFVDAILDLGRRGRGPAAEKAHTPARWHAAQKCDAAARGHRRRAC